MCYTIDLTPELFKQRIYNWAEEKGIDLDSFSFYDLKYYPHKPELNSGKTSSASKYTREFIDSQKGDESQKMANTYLLSLLKFGKELKAIEKSKESGDTKELAAILRKVIHGTIFDESRKINGSPMIKTFDAQEIQQIYVATLTTLMDNHEDKLIKKLNNILNNSFLYLDRNWKAGNSLQLTPDAADF